jgi:hypothetical protein
MYCVRAANRLPETLASNARAMFVAIYAPEAQQ